MLVSDKGVYENIRSKVAPRGNVDSSLIVFDYRDEFFYWRKKMNYNISLERAREIARQEKYKKIPLATEILSDVQTPISLLKILKNVSKHCYLLESAEQDERWGRYSFLGYDPKLEISATKDKLRIVTDTIREFTCKDPAVEIRKIIEENQSPKFDHLPPFTGGLVGYFSYDFIQYSEPNLKLDAKDAEGFKDVDLMLFDKVIAYDNYRQKIVLIVNISTKDIDTSYIAGQKELQKMITLIQTGNQKKEKSGKITSDFQYLFDKEQYCHMVEKAKHYIHEGDIFQVVLSNRMTADFEGSLLGTYRALRILNPSPYMFYFSSDDIEIAGASPETLVKLEDGVLQTFPLAGTRPRGKDAEEDARLKQELLADEKERAEHNMLVDLGRNDIGKLSKFGTVEVEKYMCIEKFSHVMHIGSTVRGEIREDKDACDAVASVLPAGTLSGAPKFRACEIINELEDDKRGIYGGAIGYIDFTGNLDTCIAIRIAYKKNGKVMVRSGAGIVADSDPNKEYQECINKAKAVVRALEIAAEEEY